MEDNCKKVEKSSLKNKSVSSNNMKILPQVIKNQHVQMKDNYIRVSQGGHKFVYYLLLKNEKTPLRLFKRHFDTRLYIHQNSHYRQKNPH